MTSRRDFAWEYAKEDEGNTVKGYMYCKFCNKKCTGGISRLKNHLAGTHYGMGACTKCPEDVKKKCEKALNDFKIQKQRETELVCSIGRAGTSNIEVPGNRVGVEGLNQDTYDSGIGNVPSNLQPRPMGPMDQFVASEALLREVDSEERPSMPYLYEMMDSAKEKIAYACGGVHTKRRNRLEQQKLNSLVFVMYNMKLRERSMRRKANANVDPILVEHIDSDDEWITEKEDPTLPSEASWLQDDDLALEITAVEVIGDTTLVEPTVINTDRGKRKRTHNDKSGTSQQSKGKSVQVNLVDELDELDDFVGVQVQGDPPKVATSAQQDLLGVEKVFLYLEYDGDFE
ncbi:hypothetical protein HHK36_027591 [Tetracentron sinense]|uniref:BED-type domain-containing protein n=1 Tax=Tetracentron sinense TaxID=13715 RepID=A0A834YF41_TETSI|nr:hypothetical protein HHK36_027591 [Tetracentron sinense]